jgi:hypothetical protein
MLSIYPKIRNLSFIVLALLIGAFAIGGFIRRASADIVSQGVPYAITAETLAPFAYSQSLAYCQTKEPEGEDPMVQQIAVNYYVKKYKVTRKEARKRIEMQDKASGIEDKIADLLGDKFAGIWYDAARGGRLQIGMVASAKGKTADLRSIAKDFDVSTSVDVVNVRYSITDLEQMRERISREIQDMILAGHVRIGYNTKANKVRLTVAAGLKAGDQARLRKIGGHARRIFSPIKVKVVTGTAQ